MGNQHYTSAKVEEVISSWSTTTLQMSEKTDHEEIEMDNQHKLISGYRDLTEEEIYNMNWLKELEATVLGVLERAKKHGADPRWLSIAKTDLQKAFMAANRAIAKPDEMVAYDEAR